MDPTESLVLIAELGIALVAAGGIVTAIGGRDRDYTPSDRIRVRSLILTSAIPLVVGLSGLTLLSAQIQPTHTWVLLSLGSVALIVALTVGVTREAARLPNSADGVPRTPLYRFPIHFILGAIVVLLLVYNGLVLHAFWPILLVCSYQLVSGVWLVLNLLLEEQ
jgi:hypothetical protein